MAFKDPERHKQYHREYNREWMRRWRAEHPEESRAQHRQYMRNWRARDRERNNALQREHSRRWRAKHPEKEARNTQTRRARKEMVANRLTKGEAQHLFMIGQVAYPGQKLHLDHIVPLSKGGGTTLANMQAIPASVNLSKGDKLPQEVYRQLGF